MSTTIGIVGGGPWGLGLAIAARSAGASPMVFSRRPPGAVPEGVTLTDSLAAVAAHSQLLVLAVPSDTARVVAERLGDVVDGHHMVVHAVRGLSGEGLRTVSAVVREETPVRRVGALAGPVLPDALAASQPSSIAIASRYADVQVALRSALASPTLRVSTFDDLTGLEWASALVGVLLIGVGYAQALGIRAGLLSALFTRGMHEAQSIGCAAGAQAGTFWSVAGIGDLMAGAMEPASRPETRYGDAFARTRSHEAARTAAAGRVEGVELLPRLVRFARARGLETPVIDALDALLRSETDVQSVWAALMRTH